MRWAYGNGTVHSMAIGLSRHYEICAKKASGRDVRKLLARASEECKDFANASWKRDREAQS